MRDVKVVAAALRLLLGATLLGAGLPKVGQPEVLLTTIEGYRLVPATLTGILAVVLPWLELATGLLLTAGLWVRASAGIAAALFAVFLIAVLGALLRGIDISCGCFGSHSARVGFPTLILDLAGLCSALVVIRRHPAPSVPANGVSPRDEAVGKATAPDPVP